VVLLLLTRRNPRFGSAVLLLHRAATTVLLELFAVVDVRLFLRRAAKVVRLAFVTLPLPCCEPCCWAVASGTGTGVGAVWSSAWSSACVSNCAPCASSVRHPASAARRTAAVAAPKPATNHASRDRPSGSPFRSPRPVRTNALSAPLPRHSYAATKHMQNTIEYCMAPIFPYQQNPLVGTSTSSWVALVREVTGGLTCREEPH
jgi:hypothetical protein